MLVPLADTIVAPPTKYPIPNTNLTDFSMIKYTKNGELLHEYGELGNYRSQPAHVQVDR
jgi:hypothetical protein